MEKGRRNLSWFLLLIFIFLTKSKYSGANKFYSEEDTNVKSIGQVTIVEPSELDENDEVGSPSVIEEPSELEPEDITKKTVEPSSRSELLKEIIEEGYQNLKNNQNTSTIIMCTVILVAFFIALIVIICITRNKQEKEEVVAMEEGKKSWKIPWKKKNKPSTTK
ncbi:hypothetical protein XELAEV_18026467mg [Xenopus laevis]|uniref:Uncharacterized protein n=1 Tax=Xenopus laevis TaxID=8355 RepID=A0A974CTT6_XENLA|nr:hypothetical protein XELAEV_18026467mg [Xenopus laevis]